MSEPNNQSPFARLTRSSVHNILALTKVNRRKYIIIYYTGPRSGELDVVLFPFFLFPFPFSLFPFFLFFFCLFLACQQPSDFQPCGCHLPAQPFFFPFFFFWLVFRSRGCTRGLCMSLCRSLCRSLCSRGSVE